MHKLFLLNVVVNVGLFFSFLFLQSYPTVLMTLHICSLLTLWVQIGYNTKVRSLISARWKEVGIIIVFIFLSLGVGLYKVESITPGIYGDEVTVGRKSLELLEKPGLPPFDGVYSHPTPLMYMTAGSIHLFGRTKMAVRLPSIIFGAVAVGAFYVLLRLFFPIKMSIIGTSLLLSQYTHIVLSRLAYEPPASLFFQILCGIFIVLYLRTKERLFLIATALAVGAGLYTYLNFRSFAVLICVSVVIAIIKLLHKQYKTDIFIFCATLFIAVMPLVSYSILDPHGFWLRPAEISIFGRHYSPSEFAKELGGNALRLVLFPAIGDPNPGKNPAGFPLFDPMTLFVAAIGCIALFQKKRFLFWCVLILLIPPFVSDLFSTEVIPDFHYYGLGHPNALRVSGWIPVILFAATAGVEWLYTQGEKKHFSETIIGIGLLVGTICVWNTLLYFNQKAIHPRYFAYNYDVNHQDYMDLIEYVEKSPAQTISMTKPIAEFEHVPFFLHDRAGIVSFDPVSTESARTVIENSDLTAIDITEKTIPILSGFDSEDTLQSMGVTVRVLTDPVLMVPKIAVFEKEL